MRVHVCVYCRCPDITRKRNPEAREFNSQVGARVSVPNNNNFIFYFFVLNDGNKLPIVFNLMDVLHKIILTRIYW